MLISTILLSGIPIRGVFYEKSQTGLTVLILIGGKFPHPPFPDIVQDFEMKSFIY